MILKFNKKNCEKSWKHQARTTETLKILLFYSEVAKLVITLVHSN